jgi:hypothetical protein
MEGRRAKEGAVSSARSAGSKGERLSAGSRRG